MSLLSQIVFIAMISSGYAIKCFVCNSHNNTDCTDLSGSAKQKYTVDCDTKNGDKQYTLCRKIDFYMDMDYGKYHKAEYRVHRDCAYEAQDTSEQDCYYKSGHNTRSWVCACDKDECNTAASTFFSVKLVALATLSAVFVKNVIF